MEPGRQQIERQRVGDRLPSPAGRRGQPNRSTYLPRWIRHDPRWKADEAETTTVDDYSEEGDAVIRDNVSEEGETPTTDGNVEEREAVILDDVTEEAEVEQETKEYDILPDPDTVETEGKLE